MIELPEWKGFYRTHLGFYVADHKTEVRKSRDETFELIYRDGARPISNTDWSRIATLSEEEINSIEDDAVRAETLKAHRLMLVSPAQFVGLSVRGNRVLEEPDGFGIRILEKPLKTGHIEVYDHDVSKIKLGEPQRKYYEAKLWVDESATENDVRYAVRFGDWLGSDSRFYVDLLCGPRDSSLMAVIGEGPNVAGLGFRPHSAGNSAYVQVNAVAEKILRARAELDAAKALLG